MPAASIAEPDATAMSVGLETELAHMPLVAATGKILPLSGTGPAKLPPDGEKFVPSKESAMVVLPVLGLRVDGLEDSIAQLLPTGPEKAQGQAGPSANSVATIEQVSSPAVMAMRTMSPSEIAAVVPASPSASLGSAVTLAPAAAHAAPTFTTKVSGSETANSASEPVQSGHGSRIVAQAVLTQPTAATGQASLSAEQVTVSITAATVRDQGASTSGPAAFLSLVGEITNRSSAARTADQPAGQQEAASHESQLTNTMSARSETPDRRTREGSDRREAGPDRLTVFARSLGAETLSPMSATPMPTAERTVTITPPAIAFSAAAGLADPFEAVAAVVERLTAAREAGLGSLASVAIGNRDFGEITVNFVEKGKALEVSLTAADYEKQQALAAALNSADRPVARDAAVSAAPSTHLSSEASQHERGAQSQLARDDSGRRDAREPANERRAAARPAAGETGASEPERSGIYV